MTTKTIRDKAAAQNYVVQNADNLNLRAVQGAGGDTIFLNKFASDYTVKLKGGPASAKVITLTGADGQTIKIHLPKPANGGSVSETVAFLDGDAKLTYSVNATGVGTVTLGTQTVTNVLADVTTDVTVAPPARIDPFDQNYTLSTTDSPNVTEGDTGTKQLWFTVVLNQVPQADTTINYQTLKAASTASLNDNDYVPVAYGQVTFLAGQTVAYVPVTVNGDTQVENNETVQVKFFGANIGNAGNAFTVTGTIVNDDIVAPVTVFNLTTGTDSFIGTTVNETYLANISSGANTLTAFDKVDGGAGTDTLTISSSTGIDTTALSLSVTNVENVNFNSSAGITADTKGWGATSLNVSNAVAGDVTLTADTTTAILATNVFNGGDLTVSGGFNQTLIAVNGSIATSGATGTINATVNSAGANASTYNGGTNVTVTESGLTTGTITIGNSAAPTGIVTATLSSSAGGNFTTGPVAIKGGTSVSVSDLVTNSTVNTTTNTGAITVTGTAATTSVSVTQSAAVTATGSVGGITNGAVTIADANGASATAANTIASVTLSNYGNSTITDSALTSLSLSGTAGTLGITNNATTPTNTTLALAINGLSGTNAISDNGKIKALNITTGATASTVAGLGMGAVTAVTLAGNSALTLTSAAGLSALQTVTVSGAAGLTADLSGGTVTAVDASATTGNSTITVNAVNATYTGGAGVDKVTLSAAAPTKAISLGDGNDSLTLQNGSSTTGTIGAGNGTDTLAMTATDAATASGSGTFASKVTGFEQLVLTAATNQTVNLSALGGYNYVSTSGGNGLTLNNLPSSGTLVLTGAGTAYTISNSAFTAGTNDTVNLNLTDGSGAGVAFASTGITASDVENFAINVADTQATPTGTFNDSVTLLLNSVKSISISGNAGLGLTATSTALTNVDASGITLGGFTWTSGALAGAATVMGTTSGANTVNFSAATAAVTYTGGTGADTVTVNTSNNTIHLGSGTTSNGVTGAGAGNNTIDSTATATDTVSLGTGNNTVSLGDGINNFTATSGNNTYTGGTGVDTVTVGSGSNVISTGAGDDIINIGHGGSYVGLNTIDVGSGSDKVVLEGIQDASGHYASLTGMGAGDKIDLSAVNDGSGNTSQTVLGAKIALGGAAAFTAYLNAAAAGDGSGASVLKWFQFNNNTYVVVDTDIASTFQDGHDTVIELVGTPDLQNSTILANVVTIV